MAYSTPQSQSPRRHSLAEYNSKSTPTSIPSAPSLATSPVQPSQASHSPISHPSIAATQTQLPAPTYKLHHRTSSGIAVMNRSNSPYTSGVNGTATPTRDSFGFQSNIATPKHGTTGGNAATLPGGGIAQRSRPPSTTRETLKGNKAEDGNVTVVLRIRPSFQPDQHIPPRFARTVLHPSPSSPFDEVVVNLSTEPAPSSVITSASRESSLQGQSAGTTASPGMASGTKGKQTTFNYDKVLGEESSQAEVYESVAGTAIGRFLQGINVTVLAYGQTSSGKSYTMGTTGMDEDYGSTEGFSADQASRMGIIPRAMSEIFEQAEAKAREAGSGARWECKLSFLELYNEDLIDLLSHIPHAQAPPITIREDKGRILWSGLQEVSVSSTSQVMSLLQEGSTKRRTGETGMNKESSRSHAIFSLTLVQRRRSGVGAGSTPGTPGRAAGQRPVSTPVFPPTGIRSPTPTGTRPASRTSMLPTARAQNAAVGRGSPGIFPPDEEGRWVETVSKFHFVDLAGSERLKRTGAAGDRMKEGISINSGLSALGNVISALADAKTHHIPYRDSKLTRLLQDSLGGNAYTVMIACVSPIEYNLNETLNTLKYGARARKIKNRAEVNETEVGWDDIDHLRSTVTKLRAEVQKLKDLEHSSTPSEIDEDDDADMRSELLSARNLLAQVQAENEMIKSDLQGKGILITRLNTDLQASKRNAGINPNDSTQFSKLVEPIVEEYESLIQNLESKLQMALTNLDLGNDRAKDAEELVFMHEKRLSKQETYVADLVGRLNRLKDREESLEAYVTELEEKIRTFDESNATLNKSLADLRNELASEQHKAESNAKYIEQVEATLAAGEKEKAELGDKAHELKVEAQRKEDLYQELLQRMDRMDLTEAHKILRQDYEEQQAKLLELGGEIEEIEQVKKDVEAEREQLRMLTTRQTRELEEVRRQLHSRLITSSTRPDSPDDDSSIDILEESADLLLNGTSAKVPGSPATRSGSDEGEVAGPHIPNGYGELQAAHEATRTELEAVNARYAAALTQINDLQSQIKEVHLIQAEQDDDIPLSSRPGPMTRSTSANSVTSQGSVGSSGSTSRLGYSRRKSTGSNLTVSVEPKPDFQDGRGDPRVTNRPQSLSQELSPSRSSRTSGLASGSLLSPTSITRQSLPALRTQRSTGSLEAEIKQLQEVLRQRDVEIRTLETAMRSLHGTSPRQENSGHFPRLEGTDGKGDISADVDGGPTIAASEEPHVNHATNGLAHTSVISASTKDTFLNTEDDIERMNRLNDMMRTMAQKEVRYKAEIDELVTQLSELQQEHAQSKSVSTLRFNSVPMTPSSSDGPNASGPTESSNGYIDERGPGAGMIPSGKPGDGDGPALDERTRTAVDAVLSEYGLSPEPDWPKEPSKAIMAIGTALASANRQSRSLDIEIAQLRLQTSELADIKLSKESLLQERAAREATIKQLEKKIADLHAAPKRNSANSDNDTETAATSPVARMSFSRAATPTAKYPPITPPPSMPPPPVPTDFPALPARPISNSLATYNFPTIPARPDETPSSVGSPEMKASPIIGDLDNQEEKARLMEKIEKLESDIAELHTTLSKKDEDLHASTDLVSSLNNNLQNSERSLRKLRLQLQETTREKDSANQEVTRLQKEVEITRKEIVSVRSSVIVEKESLETRLSEERRAKERARAQLEERLAAAQLQKESRFKCF